jgi:zinc protease
MIIPTPMLKTMANEGATGGPRIQIVTASCGVEAWLVEDHNLPLLALEFAVMAGSANDPAGAAGAANLIAGLMDEGAGDMDAEAFQNALADRAIDLSFSADRDDLRGSLRTLSKHKAEAFRLLALALQKPRFDDDAVGRVKGQVSAGLRREQQDPDAVCRIAFGAEAFGGHPYAMPARGTLESVAAIEPETLRSHAASLFTRAALRIVAVGDITPAELSSMIDAVFGPLPDASPLSAPPVTALHGLGKVHVVPMDLPQTSLRYGGPGLFRDDPDYIAAEVVNHILGGSAFTSRFFLEVREKRGLAYGVSSGLVSLRKAAWHAGATATKNERVAESLDVMRGQMRALAKDGPTEGELAEALNYLIGSFALRFDASSKIASQLLSFALNGLDAGYVARRNDLFRSVTMADARRVADRLYGADELLVVAVGQPVGLN